MFVRPLFTFAAVTLCLYALPGMAQQAIPNPQYREADMVFSKRVWRIVDLREKQNKRATWPGNPITKILYEAVRTGQLKPYRSDSLKRYYSIEEVMQFGTDTTFVETPIDPTDPTITKMDTVIEPFDPETRIQQLLIMEDLVFDSKRSSEAIRIIAIAPLYRMKVSGIDLGLRPLCWLRFDDRPDKEKDVRDLLSKQYMFNAQNSYSTFSYDDWFTQRLFNSYIIKVSNQYDVSIMQDPEYRKGGIEALIEAERIKRQNGDDEQHRYED